MTQKNRTEATAVMRGSKYIDISPIICYNDFA